jgi:hypothetical protein
MTKPMQRSYLLRLWRDHVAAPLRVTLIAVERPEEPRHFANLDDLFAFVSAQADPATQEHERLQWGTDYCTPDTPR